MRLLQIICDGSGAAELAAQLAAELEARGERAPDWLCLQASVGVDVDALRRAVAAAFPDTPVHGATSCLGAMTNAGARIGPGGAVGALALWDEAGDYATVAARLGDDPAEAARAAVAAACAAAGRPGEAPDLVWFSAVPGREERLLDGINAAVGEETPVFGGSAADDDVTGRWSVFDATARLTDGLVVSVLFPSGRVGNAFQSGYAPAGPAATVTAGAGRHLAELDGRPAREVFDAWTGGKVVQGPADGAVSVLSASTWSPLGRPDGTVAEIPFHLLLHPAQAEADGSLTLFADVAVGDRLYLMAGSPESLTARAARTATLAMETADIAPCDVAGALIIFCGGSMLAMQDAMGNVAQQLDAALEGAPFLAGFTFGEQGHTIAGHNCHGNLMISAVVFARS